jgi:tripartite-type tricarboxylate transporter receptor subunit TctC
MMNRISRLALSLLLALAAGSSFAQNYPSKPVRIIVPFLPGGGVDVLARAFAQKFTEAWGQQFIVDNRAHASHAGHH